MSHADPNNLPLDKLLDIFIAFEQKYKLDGTQEHNALLSDAVREEFYHLTRKERVEVATAIQGIEDDFTNLQGALRQVRALRLRPEGQVPNLEAVERAHEQDVTTHLWAAQTLDSLRGLLTIHRTQNKSPACIARLVILESRLDGLEMSLRRDMDESGIKVANFKAQPGKNPNKVKSRDVDTYVRDAVADEAKENFVRDPMGGSPSNV